ncbi:autotransporter outer membrane beta-barrel domain-containing protein [Microvirga sp. W0021]|uniref:Autotransporter outer membrane beta-barrel domain-containing protein n=1 Tax=Hohaiivirga grylli TaxID=3133970 RepID=A0ABV0BEW9_9HYPH
MKINFSGVSLAVLVSSFISGSAFAAEPFCKSYHTLIGLTGDSDGYSVTGTQCLELAASQYENGGYARTANNMTIENQGKLSVLGFLTNSTVKSGGYVVVSKTTHIAVDGYDQTVPALADNITIEKGGLLYAFDGGTLQNSTIYGQANIYYANLNETGRGINNTVASGGVYYTYLGAQSDGTKVLAGGNEYVQTNATSNGSIIYSGGAQQVSSFSTANNARIEAGGSQYVIGNAEAHNTIVAGGAQYAYKASSGTTGAGLVGLLYNSTVSGNGRQQIQDGGLAFDTTFYDQSFQLVYADSITHNTYLHDSTISKIYDGGQATGEMQVYDQSELQLVAAATNGAFAENVQLNGENTKVVVLSGTDDQDSASIGTLNGNGIVYFRHDTENYVRLNVDNLSGSMLFRFSTSIADGRGDYLTIQNGSGSHQVVVMDSGAEITSPATTTLDLITDASAGASFSLASLTGVNTAAVDGGTYMYTLNNRDEAAGRIWFLAAGYVENPPPVVPPTVDPVPTPTPEPVPTPSPAPQVTDLRTTPSTDALISMSVAPGMMFANELGNLRFRKGDLGFMSDSQRKGGVWARVIGSSATYSPSVAKFRMQQEGFEAGTDYLFDMSGGKGLVGVFASYSQADIKHKRGGTSRIGSTSVGLQLGYFADNGFYVDGILKYNNFDNDLRAISTNGYSVSGSYDRNAFGGSLEAGYAKEFSNGWFIEPYVKLTYFSVEGKTVHLSNGMKGKMSAYESLTSEIALTIGKTIKTEDVIWKPYVTAGWSYEFMDSNKVVINDLNQFNTNFTGSMGRIGVGVSAQLKSGFLIYGEVNYRAGRNVTAPVQANFGLRYQF